ncbi:MULTISPECIES: recombinase family protein [Aeromonas]|uniref:recombinase family protein n=1 Tax=Aeromonas TaxID=642 RepID=UPI001FCAC1C8|nr:MULTISPECIES: recombinase family protein [Aeromonas]MCJ2368875.1 recombinase family protein [Aeromonas dhakensis]MCO4203183.1 recombinase family protein [Aeromonas taiwanensis]
MQRYNSTHEQFNTAKEAANATYFTKLRDPVEELLAFGYGYNALSSALNAKGYLTQRGKPFTRESVRTLLKNLGVHTVGAEEECSKEQ